MAFPCAFLLNLHQMDKHIPLFSEVFVVFSSPQGVFPTNSQHELSHSHLRSQKNLFLAAYETSKT
jgi:hypothetical protein